MKPGVPLISLLLLAFGASCADSPRADPDAATTDATATDTAAEDGWRPASEVQLLGDCERPVAQPLATRTIFSGRYTCAPPAAPSELVVSTEAAWAPVAADLAACSDAPAPAAIDFASEYAVVLGVSAFQTCGVTLDEVLTLSDGATPYVEAAFTDRSAGCATACALGGAFVVVLALPRAEGTDPTVCRRVHPGCD